MEDCFVAVADHEAGVKVIVVDFHGPNADEVLVLELGAVFEGMQSRGAK